VRVLSRPLYDQAGTVTTVAGTGALGCTDGSLATFNDPTGICIDAQGVIYVCDAGSHTVRRVNSNGSVVTIAGSGRPGYADGVGAAASFSYPYGIAAATDGTLLVADSCNHCIRRVTVDGVVTTLAGRQVQGATDGNGTRAAFNYPTGIAVDQTSGMAYVADRSNHRVRTVDKFGAVRTFAGSGISGYSDGPALKSMFEWPHAVAVDSVGNVFVSDTFTFQVRRISKDGSVVKRVCRGGERTGRVGDRQPATGLKCIAIDSKRNDVMYLTDQANHCVQRINFISVNSQPQPTEPAAAP
jgi:DNA-binding beta-propeller fold protein YncE